MIRDAEAATKIALAWAEAEGLEVIWHDDWSVGNHREFYGEAYDEGEPTTCEWAAVVDDHDNVLASLGCIDGADDAYRREIVADLLVEAMPSVVKLATAGTGVGL